MHLKRYGLAVKYSLPGSLRLILCKALQVQHALSHIVFTALNPEPKKIVIAQRQHNTDTECSKLISIP